MRRTVLALAVVLFGACLLTVGTAPVLADELCAMGGAMLKAGIDKEKALDWARDRREVAIANEDGDDWQVLTLSDTDDGIAILVTAEYVFFGAAGRGGREVDERAAQKAFGNELRKLREAVKKDVQELWKAGVVKIQGNEVQAIAGVAGLGVIEKDGRDWKLETEDCQGVDIDTSDL